MSEKFLKGLEFENNFTTTENGAIALKSTGDELVNLFAQCGALRTRTNMEIERMFSRAMAIDSTLALRMLFYTRNIRGGLGERRTFRIALKYLANEYPSLITLNLHNIAHFGRWDDLFELFDTKVENEMLAFVKKVLIKDTEDMAQGKKITLLAKWMKSTNASSKVTIAQGRKLAVYLGMKERSYRKLLSEMRGYLSVVEKQMSVKEWVGINYPQVPSKAMNVYRHAFSRNDPTGFAKYMAKVESGEVKINASTLYPYDIVEKVLYRGERNNVLEEQWKALPDYLDGESHNILIMADVSGSMVGRPMATSIGLALYFSQRNKGAYANKFLTFSSRPQIVDVVGNSLFDKIRNISKAEWGMSTNLEGAFDLILNVAIQSRLTQDELPKSLVIISDQEMNQCVNNYDQRQTFFDKIKDKYAQYGYEMPNVVFWNVNSRNDVFQVDSMCPNVQLVGGQSASTFANVIKGSGLTPYEMMIETLSDPMYDCVVTL